MNRKQKIALLKKHKLTKSKADPYQKFLSELDKLHPKFSRTDVKILKEFPIPAVKPGREVERPKSFVTLGSVALKPNSQIYTGDKVKGIGVMHKSSMVPIFTDQEAIDIAKMRRN